MSPRHYIQFPDQGALINAATETAQNTLSAALEHRGHAHFLCSGGSTPGPVYTALSKTPLDWAKITVGLTDERYVSRQSDGSNMALLDRTLLQNYASEAAAFPLVADPTETVEQAASTADEIYKQNLLPADLMILGMGGDAHTLSWFADADGLQNALDLKSDRMVISLTAPQTRVTGPYTSRITLTRPAIAAARQIILLITGEEKRTVFETATQDTPIAHMIEAAGERLTTYWAP